jgi:hypothetical protein
MFGSSGGILRVIHFVLCGWGGENIMTIFWTWRHWGKHNQKNVVTNDLKTYLSCTLYSMWVHNSFGLMLLKWLKL